MEIFRIRENHSSLGNDLSIFPCLITYILIKMINLRKFHLIQPYTGKCRHFHPLFFFPDNCSTCTAHCKFHQNLMSIQCLIRHIQTDGFLKFKMLAVHICSHSHPALLFTGKHHRCKKSLCIIMQSLPASIIINRRPGNYRPAVIQLPVDRTHTTATVSAVMLHSITDAICLKKLRCIHKITEILRITISSLHILRNLSVTAIISLMFLHHIRKRIQFSRIICHSLQSLYRRE